ncbi:MAG TPA: CpXC domain-containing protein [Methanocorpusculum sp.]|nr:CpXC domain-containing protein [Methanocorpusculum sp.]
MKSVLKTISCPKCGSKQEFTMYTSINAATDKELSDKYLSGELTTLKCQHCGFTGIVEYPLLYHDLNKKFSIFFSPDKDTRSEPLPKDVLPHHLVSSMRFRLVHHSEDFREKIFIFRDSLDDRIIETVKDSIIREMKARSESVVPTALYYAQDMFECSDRSLIFVPKSDGNYLDPIKVPFSTYTQIKTIMSSIWDRDVGTDGYCVVDNLWVQSPGNNKQSDK